MGRFTRTAGERLEEINVLLDGLPDLSDLTKQGITEGSTWRAIRYRIKSQRFGKHTCLRGCAARNAAASSPRRSRPMRS
jgi:hypothetical protein